MDLSCASFAKLELLPLILLAIFLQREISQQLRFAIKFSTFRNLQRGVKALVIGHFSAWKNHLLQRNMKASWWQDTLRPITEQDLPTSHSPGSRGAGSYIIYTGTQEKTCKFACVSEHLKRMYRHTQARTHAHQRTNLCCTPDLICGIQVNICSLSPTSFMPPKQSSLAAEQK